ncbi:carboxymuconolactone decarboxylase family protein [Fontimonas sp. SYSU GA230001]|uniref:carboxymuconolactone decarboxylase family protein n=1 Tax=Fontimonas sp. SYSU GA230001 TaxID=3142450 RepID=UPI0032B375DD
MSARLVPLDPPYTAEIQAAFDVVMRGAPPLKLFRTVAHNPRVLQRMMAGGLLDRGSIPMRLRELMILRTTALCGAEYEWGVHVAAFAAKAGLSEAEWRATASGADPGSWSGPDRLVLRLAQALYDTHTVDDALWEALAAAFDPAQCIELIMLAGQYHGISFLLNALRVEHESGAPRWSAGA